MCSSCVSLFWLRDGRIFSSRTTSKNWFCAQQILSRRVLCDGSELRVYIAVIQLLAEAAGKYSHQINPVKTVKELADGDSVETQAARVVQCGVSLLVTHLQNNLVNIIIQSRDGEHRNDSVCS